MPRRPDRNRHRAAHAEAIAKLDRITREAQATATARDKARMLYQQRDEGTKEQQYERIVYSSQGLRDAGRMEPDEAAAYIARFVMAIAEERIYPQPAYPELDEISEKIRVVERAHGLTDDEYWLLGEGPPEYEALVNEWDRVHDRIVEKVFREYGEPELADLYRDDREEFDQLIELMDRLRQQWKDASDG